MKRGTRDGFRGRPLSPVKSALTCFLALAALAGTSSASALSWSRVPPHQRPYAICEAGRLADYINAEWADFHDRVRLPDKYVGYLNIFLYTDQLGKVGQLNSHTYDGKPAGAIDFVESLRTANGKDDVGPIVASRLVLLQADKTMPVYLLSLRRTKWEIYQTLPDMETVQEYQTSESIWMMQFKGNELNLMRQADELAPAAARGVNLLTQKFDCEALWRRDA
jgi:hypothetical protein